MCLLAPRADGNYNKSDINNKSTHTSRPNAPENAPIASQAKAFASGFDCVYASRERPLATNLSERLLA
jgi:hypothetical protein